MVHHIVMWKFKPEVEDAKKPELKKAMAENLKSLVGKVPGLLTVDFVEAPLASSTHDMALVTTLEKAEDVPLYFSPLLLFYCQFTQFLCKYQPFVTALRLQSAEYPQSLPRTCQDTRKALPHWKKQRM